MQKFVKVALWTLVARPAARRPPSRPGRRRGDSSLGLRRSAPVSRSASPVSAAASARASRPATPRPASRATRAPPARCSSNFILGMVLIESIAIYGLVIAFLLVGQDLADRRLGDRDAGRELDAGLTPLMVPASNTVPPSGASDPARPPVPSRGRGGKRLATHADSHAQAACRASRAGLSARAHRVSR